MVDQERKNKWKVLGRRRRWELQISKEDSVEGGSQTSYTEDGNDTKGKETFSDNNIWDWLKLF
jgi:hypothetical protein